MRSHRLPDAALVAVAVWFAGTCSVGGVVSRTMMEVDAVADAPWMSVAVSVTTWVPRGSVTAIVVPVPRVAAPFFHTSDTLSPASGSLPDPESVTGAPAGDVASNGG